MALRHILRLRLFSSKLICCKDFTQSVQLHNTGKEVYEETAIQKHLLVTISPFRTIKIFFLANKNSLRGIKKTFLGLTDLLRGIKIFFLAFKSSLRGIKKTFLGLADHPRGIKLFFLAFKSSLRGLKKTFLGLADHLQR